MRNLTLTFALLLSLTTTVFSQMDYKTSLEVVPLENESEELLVFSETGTAKLHKGEATIEINSEIQKLLQKGARIDEILNISLQLEEESNGIYMGDIKNNTFIVKELNKGTSNATFSYKITLKKNAL